MFDTVKSMTAFKQKVDFLGGHVTKIIKHGTDVDFLCRLANNRMAAVEVKKDTPNHTVEKILESTQWEDYRDSMKSTTYLIYVTHDRPISEEDIPVEALTVRYVEVNGQEIKELRDLKFEVVINYLGSLDTTYMKVHYTKTDEIEYVLKHPVDNRWSTNHYWATIESFSTVNMAKGYIKHRYEKDFNRSYIYEIWQIDGEGNHCKIEEVEYQSEESVTC